jgi:hypothetical protein
VVPLSIGRLAEAHVEVTLERIFAGSKVPIPSNPSPAAYLPRVPCALALAGGPCPHSPAVSSLVRKYR